MIKQAFDFVHTPSQNYEDPIENIKAAFVWSRPQPPNFDLPSMSEMFFPELVQPPITIDPSKMMQPLWIDSMDEDADAIARPSATAANRTNDTQSARGVLLKAMGEVRGTEGVSDITRRSLRSIASSAWKNMMESFIQNDLRITLPRWEVILRAGGRELSSSVLLHLGLLLSQFYEQNEDSIVSKKRSRDGEIQTWTVPLELNSFLDTVMEESGMMSMSLFEAKAVFQKLDIVGHPFTRKVVSLMTQK
ncbi:hypothetical protein PROFUN_06678 [Planoprotostelium fungivorum]|uniref:Uncharacterized protein n=1 Tax=Planoprotostelium fungivorum TaxID=1890364 RepID=A0A2P6NG40_9EUKA|nr:hypothetical protein PROFUN_12825 [Planoprotostelium fungivorum]PRP82901.1 hypothetical protein PROFUN_06678 [Planoprotostelium fungivorum]